VTDASTGGSRFRLLDAILRRRLLIHLVLAATFVIGASQRVTKDTDWQFFTWGSDLLFGQHHLFQRLSYSIDPTLPGGLHLYANYSFLQIGPPAFLAAKALQWGPQEGLLLSGVVIAAMGVLYIGLLEAVFPRRGRYVQLGALFGGALVTLVWAMVMYYRHLDDALTLLALAVATVGLERRRPVVSGLALGLAAASKPWGIPLLALVLALPTTRARVQGAAAAAAVCIASWGPFLIADAKTFDIGHVQLHVAPDSPLAAMGVHVIRDGGGIRLAQFGIGLIVVAAIAARGGWAAAPLAAFAVRLALEPAAYPYYAAGVVAAAYLADVALRRGAVPLLTLAAAAGWGAAQVASGTAAGWIRLVTYLALLVTAAALGARRRRRAPEVPRTAVPSPTT
jgi:hypothetical protein